MDLRICFIVPYVISAAAIFGTGLYTHLRRDSTGAMYLAWALFGAGWWTLTEGLLYLGATPESNILITKLQYLGFMPVSPLFFLFIMEVFGLHDAIVWQFKLFLLLVIAITLVFAFGYPHINLLWKDHYQVTHGLFPMLAWRHGPYFWVLVAFQYSLLAASTIILIRSVGFADPLMKKRAKIFLASLIPPLVFEGIYITGFSPLFNVDVGPLAFSISAMAMVYGYYKYSMLDIFPAAQKALYHHMNDLLFILDPKDRVVEVNPAAASMLDIDTTWAVGRSTNEVLKNWPELAGRLAAGRGGMIDSAAGMSRRTYDLRLTPLRDRRGRPLGKLAALRDTSTLPLAALNNHAQLMAILDRKGILTDANEDFLQHTENTLGEIGRPISDHPNLLNQPENLIMIDQAFTSNQTATCEFEYHGRVYENRLFPIEEESGLEARMLCIIRDVTEEKLMGNRIMHAKKMTAIGRLATSLAHELRNPLGLIRNYGFLLKRQLGEQDKSDHLEAVQAIESAVDQAMVVINHLLGFSRTPAGSNTGCDVAEVIKRVSALTSKTATKAGVDISIDCPVGWVECVSADSLNIILLNLLTNAVDAMPDGGPCRITGRIEDHQLKLLVADTGVGIDQHHIDQIFEPFFTTKQNEKGTGFGLYIVYNEVHKYGGSIQTESLPQKGTTFTLLFPLKSEDGDHESRGI